MRTEEGPAQVQGTESVEARTRARRRLLRGSFAVPTVLTLSSGAALARSSSVRAFDNWKDVFPVPANVRSVDRYKVRMKSGDERFVVQASDILAMEVGGKFETKAFAGGKTWVDVKGGDDRSANFDSTPTKVAKDVALRVTYTETAAGGYFTVTGLAHTGDWQTSNTAGGKMLAASAWCSFQGMGTC